MATPTRIYHVRMKDETSFLVEAISQEQAVKTATAPLVESTTIPTPLETLRLQADGAKLISATAPAPAVTQVEDELEPTEEMGRKAAEAIDNLHAQHEKPSDPPPVVGSKRGHK